MDTRETPATKAAEAAAPQREPGDICALATKMLPIVTQKRAVTHDPSGFVLNGSVHLK